MGGYPPRSIATGQYCQFSLNYVFSVFYEILHDKAFFCRITGVKTTNKMIVNQCVANLSDRVLNWKLAAAF